MPRRETPCLDSDLLERCASAEAMDESARAHLQACRRCRAEFEQIRQDHQLVHELRDAHANAPAADDVSPGHVEIPGYCITREITRGGQGVVYEARQVATHRTVAVKVALTGGLANAARRRRFEREVELVASLKHPHIITLHDSGATADGRSYLVMEHVEGVRLDEYVRRRRASAASLPLDDLLALFHRICLAVAWAHQHGVMHRDLKPANILVVEEQPSSAASTGPSSGSGSGQVDSVPQPKILDFGLARHLDGGDASRLTITGDFLGTVAYAAPEQLSRNAGDVDVRSDVYALGVILYEMLTGRRPHRVDGAIADLVRAITEDEPAPPRSVVRRWGRPPAIPAGSAPYRVDADLESIVLKALAKEKDRRYQSAADLAADLHRYRSDEPIIAHPASTTYQLRRFVRRHKALMGAASAVVLALVVGLCVSLVLLARATRAQVASERAQRESRTVTEFLQSMLASVRPSEEERRGRDVLMRDVLDDASRRIEEETVQGGLFTELPLVEASIRATLGVTYEQLGMLPEAERHLRLSRALRLRHLGEWHEDTIEVSDQLAIAWSGQSRFADAETIHLRCLEMGEQTYGSEHPVIVRAKHNLALVYAHQGRNEEAERLAAEVVEIREMTLGPDHPDTLAAMNNLAIVYRGQGRDDAAETVLSRVLESQRRTHGWGHVGTFNTANNLAGIYASNGLHEKAEALYEEVLASGRRVLGPEHPRTLVAMSNLARLYRDMGRVAEAEGLQTDVVDIQQRVRGDDHPDTLSSMHSLGVLYAMTGRYDEAEPIFARVVEMRRRTAGDENVETLRAISNLAAVFMETGRLEDAEPLLVDVLEAHRRKFGDEHRMTLFSRQVLSNLYAEQGRFEDALRQAEQALEGRRRTLGRDHPGTRDSLRSVAASHVRLGRPERAEALLRESLERDRAVFGEDHAASIEALGALADFLIERSRFAEAEDLARECLERCSRARPEDDALLRAARERVRRLSRKEDHSG